MPYVSQDRREKLSWLEPPVTVGELNYIITKACWEYITSRSMNYELINSVIGVLDCAKLELYRRVLSPYEDKKKLENGDVYV